MSYSQRVSTAIVVSALAHILLLMWAGLSRVDAIPKPKPTDDVPIIVNFSPPPELEPELETEEQLRKRLIETPNPTDEPVENADLISDNNSKAADMSEETGERLAPTSENESDFEQVELEPTLNPQLSPPEPVVPPVPEPQPEETPETSEAEDVQEDPLEIPVEPVPTRSTLLEQIEEGPEEAEQERETEKEPEEQEENPVPERFDLAQATAPSMPKPVMQDIREGRTRENSGTDRRGELSFEANQHEMGEYMLHVRRKVEQMWRTAIRLKHTSVRHAEASVRVVIRPDGTIEKVEIVDEGTSIAFAVLSSQAVRDAGPFDEFPFDIPEVYRSQNLDITWRFSYN